jgi:hypothetical protein
MTSGFGADKFWYAKVFVVVKDLKALLPQVAHRMMLCIPDYIWHQYLIDFDFNLEWGNLRAVGLRSEA